MAMFEDWNLECLIITGRPNLRWVDGLPKDAEKLGVRKLKARARDRDDWRRLLESAKTLHGL